MAKYLSYLQSRAIDQLMIKVNSILNETIQKHNWNQDTLDLVALKLKTVYLKAPTGGGRPF